MVTQKEGDPQVKEERKNTTEGTDDEEGRTSLSFCRKYFIDDDAPVAIQADIHHPPSLLFAPPPIYSKSSRPREASGPSLAAHLLPISEECHE
jgi:hypothetical protein